MNSTLLDRNRVIFCHFDSYSAALLFARFGTSVLAPSPLPEGASAMSGFTASGAEYEPAAAVNALAALYGFNATELTLVDGFEEWVNAESPIRIHLARFTTFEPPRDALERHGGLFKPISEMRGMAMHELHLLRRAFNLIIG